VSTRIERIQNAVEKLHNCRARHIGSDPIRDTFEGKTVWEGVVETFEVDHPKDNRCYAWEIPGEKLDWVAVLGIPPVVSPPTAVRASVVAGRKPVMAQGERSLGKVYGMTLTRSDKDGHPLDVSEEDVTRIAEKIKAAGLSGIDVQRKQGENGKFKVWFSGSKEHIDQISIILTDAFRKHSGEAGERAKGPQS
jgi:hypothetical protein